jgi:hypothetical protein
MLQMHLDTQINVYVFYFLIFDTQNTESEMFILVTCVLRLDIGYVAHVMKT